MKLIVGVDPGMITAVAAVDINSDFYYTFSKRSFSFSEICDHLVNVGEPVVVATDTMHMPDAVRKISSAFNSRYFLPKRDLLVGEKKRLIEEKDVGNEHERDALASAVYAKSSFSALFKKIDTALEKKTLMHLSASVKELLIKNEAGNIEQAIKLLTSVQHKELRIVPRIIESKGIIKLRQRLASLEEEKRKLEKTIRELEEENRKLLEETEMLSKKDESRSINNLRKSIAAVLEEKNSLEAEYKEFKDLSAKYEIIAGAGEAVSGRVIIPKGNIDVKRIEEMEPKAIISDDFIDTCIPVIHTARIEVKKIGSFLVIDKKELEGVLQSGETFLDWLGKYKSRYQHEAKT